LYLSSGSNQKFGTQLWTDIPLKGWCCGGDGNYNKDILWSEPYETCLQQIKDRCASIGHPVTSATSINQGEIKTFEQQVSMAQGKDTNTRAAGHEESKSSNTELPECITLGFSGSTAGCTTYCTDNGLEFSDYAQIGDDGTVTCMCTKDGTTTNVCIKPLAGPNTEGKPCTNFGITDNQSCTDYCNGFGEWDTTETDGKITSSSCACGSIDIDGSLRSGFYCTSGLGTSSSSALSLLLPGAVVTVTTYLITMGI
jgi:hypothetical protein